ncbi:uncharacterized protein [Aegilops tauschii subsp. strangulata]|uniref:uncharacterized protein n=1 Tax=Aegilops tauschii subsp. strangulata TaxID=200361 RepID=UPI00098ACA00|nr:uncharacterized protein LOC109763763 [Aegilops tauschii subsp. strangulata]
MDSADEFFFHSFLCDSDDSSSDDEEEILAAVLVHHHLNRQRPLSRGSIPGHLPALNRNRESGYFLLWKDYFDTTNPLFKHQKFGGVSVWVGIFSTVLERGLLDTIIILSAKRMPLDRCFSSYQKCTGAIRMLAYGVPGDLIDEYVRMSESTCLHSMYKFCKAVIVVFGPEYLSEPTAQDTARLLAMNASKGFPGMLGSIDCMYWEWKNCPSTWQGQYKGHVRACTVILEAVASQDLWIWHSFFGMARLHNDINVLQRSPVFARLAEGNSPLVNVTINGHNYDKGYYLCGGIHP